MHNVGRKARSGQKRHGGEEYLNQEIYLGDSLGTLMGALFHPTAHPAPHPSGRKRSKASLRETFDHVARYKGQSG